MSWSTRKLGDVAPSKPLKNITLAKVESVWQLTLDQVEANSGRIIEREVKQICDAGTSTHWFDERYVLYSKLRPYLNKVVLPDSLGLCTSELVPLLPKTGVLDQKYLTYYLRSPRFVSWVSEQTAGAKMPRVSMKLFWDHEIPLPPLETQKQIAAVLEKADQLRKDCQKMEQELNSLAQSVFIEMFGDPVTNPKGWKTQMLGAISKVQLGKMLSSASKKGINAKKYLRNANVKWRSIEIHDLLEMDFTDKETGKFQLITGDLLVCEGGEIGRCAIWTGQVEDCYYQKALHRVRLNTDLATAEYIQEYFFWMAKLGGLISSTNEVTFKHLTAEKMNKLVVPLPPIEAQRKFKNIYSSIQSELEHNAEQMAQTEMGFQSLMQKAFNGELNLDNAKTQ